MSLCFIRSRLFHLKVVQYLGGDSHSMVCFSFRDSHSMGDVNAPHSGYCC